MFTKPWMGETECSNGYFSKRRKCDKTRHLNLYNFPSLSADCIDLNQHSFCGKLREKEHEVIISCQSQTPTMYIVQGAKVSIHGFYVSKMSKEYGRRIAGQLWATFYVWYPSVSHNSRSLDDIITSMWMWNAQWIAFRQDWKEVWIDLKVR